MIARLQILTAKFIEKKTVSEQTYSYKLHIIL